MSPAARTAGTNWHSGRLGLAALPSLAHSPRDIECFVCPGFALLDLSGPLEAFQTAEELRPGSSYQPRVLSLSGGAVRSSTGLSVMTEAVPPAAVDTLLEVGDFALPDLRIAADTIEFLRATSSGASLPIPYRTERPLLGAPDRGQGPGFAVP